jgi:hypothetical protein
MYIGEYTASFIATLQRVSQLYVPRVEYARFHAMPPEWVADRSARTIRGGFSDSRKSADVRDGTIGTRHCAKPQIVDVELEGTAQVW